jgi:transcriptional regulator with XRE-family HTH domain
MAWIPDARRLRQVREQQEYTIEVLAEAAGVGEKTIRNLESGRTKRARLPTLKALAAVLDIEVQDIARPEDPPALASPGPGIEGGPGHLVAGSAGAHPVIAADLLAGLPAPSRLEQLVDRELAHGGQKAPSRLEQALALPAAMTGPDGPVLMLTPKKFQDVMTAFQLHRGRRLWLPGLVLRQRGISEAEAAALGSECGVGARFLVGQRTEVTGGEPLHVTVHTCRAEHTALLQERLETRAEVTLRLKVEVVKPEPGGRFAGFWMYGSQTPHPWTLVVEDVLG